MNNEELSDIIVCEGADSESKSFCDDRDHQLTIKVFDNPDKNLTLEDIEYRGVNSKDFHISHETLGGRDVTEIVTNQGELDQYVYEQDGKIVVLQV